MLCNIHLRVISKDECMNLFCNIWFQITITPPRCHLNFVIIHYLDVSNIVPDSKVHMAHMGPTWVLSAPCGPHVGHVNLAIWGVSVNNGIIWLNCIKINTSIWWEHSNMFHDFKYPLIQSLLDAASKLVFVPGHKSVFDLGFNNALPVYYSRKRNFNCGHQE